MEVSIELLLGGSILNCACLDPRQVIIDELRICVAGRPDLIIPCASPEDVAKASTAKYVFKVRRGIACGNSFVNHSRRARSSSLKFGSECEKRLSWALECTILFTR